MIEIYRTFCKNWRDTWKVYKAEDMMGEAIMGLGMKLNFILLVMIPTD